MTKLNANAEQYLQTLGIGPPPPITPDMPPAVQSWIEMVTAALVEAANMGDPADMAEAEKGHAERTALATDAAAKFPANEEQQAAGMDQTSQMAQQIPQMASSVAGALAGALGGVLQPLTQMPQQLAQAGQQLLQTGMGAMQQSGSSELSPEDWAKSGLGDELGAPGTGAEGGGAGDLGGGGGGGGIGAGTAPTAMLGPAATPSPTTAPMAGRAVTPMPSATPAPAHPVGGGMGGMPMMPHGGMGGGGGEAKDNKADTKRISVPGMKNGAPVQGRITTPPPAPIVTTSADGKAANRRRVVVPTGKESKEAERSDDRNGG